MTDITACASSNEFWSQALETLPPSDRLLISSSESNHLDILNHVLCQARAKRDEAASKRWKFKKSDGSTIFIRDVLDKTVQCLSRYAGVVDVAVSSDPVHAGLPWAVCRFLLNAFGSMSEGIETIAAILPRYSLLERFCIFSSPEKGSSDQRLLRECIIKVYAAVLTYLAAARKYWSDNTAARVAKSFIRDMEAQNHTLQSAVKNTDDEAVTTATLIQSQTTSDQLKRTGHALADKLRELQAPIIRTTQDLQEFKDNLHRDQRAKIFCWLSTVACELHHQEAKNKILHGTGRWLLEHPRYKEWYRSSSSEIFWLNGMPGSGKSILISIVIETFLQQYHIAACQQPPLAYFYCSKKSGDPRTADPKAILSAILRQLSGHHSKLPLRGTVSRVFQRRKDDAEDRGAQILPLSLQEVESHITAITQEDPIMIIIDALDEVEETAREDLFDALERIIQGSQNVVKVFVSSRNDGDIVERFSESPNITIKQEMNHSDIGQFIESKVTQAMRSKKLLRGKVSSALRDDIMSTLAAGARGIRLAVERDVRSELGKLPSELKQQYASIHMDILASAPSTASIAIRTFAWILAAQRALAVEEFIAAVALDEDGYFHHDLDVSQLLNLCRNLIVVVSMNGNPAKQSFQVAHLSVKEYFQELPDYNSERLHTIATLRCLQAFNPGLHPSGRKSGSAAGNVDLLRGYTIYLFEHAEQSELTRQWSGKAPLMKAFLFDEEYQSTKALSAWESLIIESFDECRYATDAKDLPFYYKTQFKDFHIGGIYLACQHGLLSVLELLESSREAKWKNTRSKYVPTLLFAATVYNHYEVARWLLERKICFADEVHYHVSSLYSAVRDDQHAMVALLLKHGANPLWRAEEGYHLTPWCAVFRTSNFDTFTILLDYIEIICTQQPEYMDRLSFDWKNEALFQALETNWIAAVRVMIQHGANVYSSSSRQDEFIPADHWSCTTLQIAVECSEIAAIDILLKTSSETDPAAQERDTSSRAPIKTKLEYVNALDDRGRHAIHFLMGRSADLVDESETILGWLLEHGADSRVRCTKGITIVHVAAAIGAKGLLEEPVALDIDLNVRSFEGATTLHFAAGGTCSTVSTIRSLIARGMDPLDKDKDGRNSLHYASASCNSMALEALLTSLLCVDDLTLYKSHFPGRNDASVRLDQDSQRLYQQIQALLDETNDKGETLLHCLASEENNLSLYNGNNLSEEKFTNVKDIARLLLELGADKDKRTQEGRTPLYSMLLHSVGPHSRIIAAKEFLAWGANANIPDTRGRTPLHQAAHYSWEEPVKDLIESGADIQAVDNESRTPLHLASDQGFSQVVRLLLRHDANVECRDRYGARPLHYAAQRYYDTTGMLIRKGADVSAQDSQGCTPLHWAAKAGNAYSVRLLLQAGADPNAVNAASDTAIQLAVRYSSIVTDMEQPTANFTNVWHQLYNALRDPRYARICSAQESPLKRSQSVILRTDQSWGDFTGIKAEELDRLS
ncbi:MAG: hypothetical protein Q9166_005153, partial [cf. Caloplaca sp. 2 TL-2023]